MIEVLRLRIRIFCSVELAAAAGKCNEWVIGKN